MKKTLSSWLVERCAPHTADRMAATWLPILVTDLHDLPPTAQARLAEMSRGPVQPGDPRYFWARR